MSERASPANTSGGTVRSSAIASASSVVGPVGLLRGGAAAPGARAPRGFGDVGHGSYRYAPGAWSPSGRPPPIGPPPPWPGIWSAWRRRISSNCCWAIACCVKRVAWMPWNSPSSQPTSWACAMRSSDSLGVSLSNGDGDPLELLPAARATGCPRARGATARGSRRSARRPASSSGARRTSSSMFRTIEAMRISLVGRRTCSSGSLPSTLSGTGPTRPSPVGTWSTTSGTIGWGSGLDIGGQVTGGPGSRSQRVAGPPPERCLRWSWRSDRGRRPPTLGVGGPGPGHVVEPVRLGVAPGLADPALAGPPRRHDREHGVRDLARRHQGEVVRLEHRLGVRAQDVGVGHPGVDGVGRDVLRARGSAPRCG